MSGGPRREDCLQAHQENPTVPVACKDTRDLLFSWGVCAVCLALWLEIICCISCCYVEMIFPLYCNNLSFIEYTWTSFPVRRLNIHSFVILGNFIFRGDWVFFAPYCQRLDRWCHYSIEFNLVSFRDLLFEVSCDNSVQREYVHRVIKIISSQKSKNWQFYTLYLVKGQSRSGYIISAGRYTCRIMWLALHLHRVFCKNKIFHLRLTEWQRCSIIRNLTRITWTYVFVRMELVN